MVTGDWKDPRPQPRPDPAETLEDAVTLMIRDLRDGGASAEEATEQTIRLLTACAGTMDGSRCVGDARDFERRMLRASVRHEAAARESMRILPRPAPETTRIVR